MFITRIRWHPVSRHRPAPVIVWVAGRCRPGLAHEVSYGLGEGPRLLDVPEVPAAVEDRDARAVDRLMQLPCPVRTADEVALADDNQGRILDRPQGGAHVPWLGFPGRIDCYVDCALPRVGV